MKPTPISLDPKTRTRNNLVNLIMMYAGHKPMEPEEESFLAIRLAEACEARLRTVEERLSLLFPPDHRTSSVRARLRIAWKVLTGKVRLSDEAPRIEGK
jgi:hypothetical protein